MFAARSRADAEVAGTRAVAGTSRASLHSQYRSAEFPAAGPDDHETALHDGLQPVLVAPRELALGCVDYSPVEESAGQAETETNSSVALGGSGCGFSATKLIVALGGSG
jgi:hypothetical protein